MNRRDLLPECAQPGTPLEVLKQEWCSRCVNPECSRSAVGTSKFEQRVLNWEDKLFKNPPLLAPDDPRFPQITAQRFITIDPGRVPEIRSDWVDPRDLKEPEPPPVLPADPPKNPKLDSSASVVPPTLEDAPPQTPLPSPSNGSISQRSGTTRSLIGANAPDQSGKILRGAPESPTNAGADPWAIPAPAPSTEEVIQPGTTIKMGRPGV